MLRAFYVTHSRKKAIRIWLCLHGFQNILQTYELDMLFFFCTEFQDNLHSFSEAIIYICYKNIVFPFLIKFSIVKNLPLSFPYLFLNGNPMDRFSQKNNVEKQFSIQRYSGCKKIDQLHGDVLWWLIVSTLQVTETSRIYYFKK